MRAHPLEGETEARRGGVVERRRVEPRRRGARRAHPMRVGQHLHQLGAQRRVLLVEAQRFSQLARGPIGSPALALGAGAQNASAGEARATFVREAPGGVARGVRRAVAVAEREGESRVEERDLRIVRLERARAVEGADRRAEIAERLARLREAHGGASEGLALFEHALEELGGDGVLPRFERVLGSLQTVPDVLWQEQDVVDEPADAVEERHWAASLSRRAPGEHAQFSAGDRSGWLSPMRF